MSKKSDRLLILNKTKGRCLYCGVDLNNTKWQADHIHPIIRHPEKGTCINPEFDVIDNLYPTCAPCNHFKSSYTIAGFRDKVQSQFEGILKYHTGARQLDRLGLITMNTAPILFWYEKSGITLPTKYELLKLEPLTWKEDKGEKDYYHTEMEEGLCSLRYISGIGWVAIFNKWGFEGRESITLNCYSKEDAQLKTTQWLFKIKGDI